MTSPWGWNCATRRWSSTAAASPGTPLAACRHYKSSSRFTTLSLITHHSSLITFHDVGPTLERCAPGTPHQRARVLTFCPGAAHRLRVRLCPEPRASAAPGGGGCPAVGGIAVCRHAELATGVSDRAGAWLPLRSAAVPV